MSEIVQTRLSSIDANPMRQLDTYPYDERKLETLQQSIRDVGLWEGVIGRKHGNRIQIAFGHHRIEAAKRELGEKAKVAIILRDLDDKQMIEFMGRENLEDWNADFLVMLESWEAACDYLARQGVQNPKAIEIARVLGWVRRHPDRTDDLLLMKVAEAASNAHKLIKDGYLTREQLAGLNVRQARDICQTIVSRHEALERMGKQTGRDSRSTDAAKNDYGKAGARVADDVRRGRTAQRDIRGQVDVRAYRHAKEARRASPLLAVAANAAAESIRKMLVKDATGEKLAEFKKALGQIELDDDFDALRRIAFECGELSERSAKWRDVFTNPKGRVVPLKEIS